MSVITISREFGSNGSLIARQVAQTLGYHLVDKQAIAKILSQYGFVEFIEEYDSAMGFWTRFDSHTTEMITMLNQVIRAIAHQDNMVILGRGSFAVLKDYTNILNVRIQAPLPARVQRVMATQNLNTLEEAEQIVKENDKMRSVFIESFYGVQWTMTKLFNLTLDTSKIPPETAVRWIVDTINYLNTQVYDEYLTTSAIHVDPVLEKVVTETFQRQSA